MRSPMKGMRWVTPIRGHRRSSDLKDDFHSDTVLSILNEQRIRGILCDVTIIVEDTKFKAHSNVLAASSLYFKNIFWSRTICISGHVLELDDLKAEVFTEILNYIYSSTVVVKRQETVTDLAAAGKKLGISFLEDLTDINFSSSPCPYAYCINEKGTVKEEKHEKRHEDSAVTNGPRITNAFSIFETENSLFSPLDLRASFKKVSETVQAPNISLDRSDVCKDAEPASTLAEHSYAVSSGGDTFQGAPFPEQDSSPSYKMGEDHYENLQATPLSQPGKQACSTAKTAFKPQGTGLPIAKVPASTVTTTEAQHEAVNDQTIISFPKPQNKAGDFHLSREEENNSASSFNDSALLSTHLQLHSEHQETFVCKYCSKQFANLNILESHEKVCVRSSSLSVHNGNEQNFADNYTATDGRNGSSYANTESLLSENSIILYTCIVCKRSYVTPSTLKMHMRCHTGEKPYTCKTCGKCFSIPGNLQKHERIHLGVKDFVCQYCNKAFTLNETLKIHERIHTGEKRYHCQFCFQKNTDALNGETSPLKLVSFTKIKYISSKCVSIYAKEVKITQKRKTSICNNTNLM
uniref:Zinc finger and BTB domain containing 38 n=1 Tax=Strix occidentalis caurina TaxID=311401 RepID=A0A8D0EMB5_STROC